MSLNRKGRNDHSLVTKAWNNNIFLDPSQGRNPTTQLALHDMVECKCGIMRSYSNCIWMLPQAIPIGFYFDFCGIAVGVI